MCELEAISWKDIMEMRTNKVSFMQTISIDELARTAPVNPPTVNKNTNPKARALNGLFLSVII